MGDISGRGWGKGRAGWGEQTQKTKEHQGWGRRNKGEEQGRRRGNKRRERSRKENDIGDDDNRKTGAREMERMRTQAGMQQRSRVGVMQGGNMQGIESRQKI